MGTDIHFFVEVSDGNVGPPRENWYGVAHVNLSRDYSMFGKLAGVRGPGPIAAPAEMPHPSSLGYHARDYFFDFKDKSLLSSKELDEAIENTGGSDKWVYIDRDFHSKGTLTGEQFLAAVAAGEMTHSWPPDYSYTAAAAMVSSLVNRVGPERVRVVFGFDS